MVIFSFKNCVSKHDKRNLLSVYSPVCLIRFSSIWHWKWFQLFHLLYSQRNHCSINDLYIILQERHHVRYEEIRKSYVPHRRSCTDPIIKQISASSSCICYQQEQTHCAWDNNWRSHAGLIQWTAFIEKEEEDDDDDDGSSSSGNLINWWAVQCFAIVFIWSWNWMYSWFFLSR